MLPLLATSLPFAAGLLLFALELRGSRDLRSAWVRASIVWAVLAVLAVEVLSCFEAVSRAGLAWFWAAVIAATLVHWLRSGAAQAAPRESEASSGSGCGLGSASGSRMHVADRLLLAALGALLAVTLAAALAAPPNSWDAMVYHMARVAHWADAGSAWHYPTQIVKQLEMGPGAEYLILQLQVLLGSDRLANVPHWIAMAGLVIVTSAIARQLGAPVVVQTLAAVLIGTLPSVVLQASGSKNDLTVAYFTLASAWSLLELARGPERLLAGSLRFGAALGLAVLTKTTSLLLGGLSLAVLGVFVLRRNGARCLVPLTAGALLALALNLPHWGRNLATFGDPLGSPQTYETMTNKDKHPRFVVSNLLRNAATQLATPWESLNRDLIHRPVVTVHEWMATNPCDPRSTHVPFMPFVVEWGRYHEDFAGNPQHTLLAALLLVIAPFVPAWRRRGLPFALTLATLGGCVVFATLINWQPWNARYSSITFALWAAPLAWLVHDLGGARATRLVAFALLAMAVPFVVYNQTRPLVGAHGIFEVPRERQYFAYAELLREDVTKALAAVIRPGEPAPEAIGLLLPLQWEYPLWPLAESLAGRPVSLRFCNGFDWPEEGRVSVPSREQPCPELVVALHKPEVRGNESRKVPEVLTDEAGGRWTRVRRFFSTSVYRRTESPSRSSR